MLGVAFASQNGWHLLHLWTRVDSFGLVWTRFGLESNSANPISLGQPTEIFCFRVGLDWTRSNPRLPSVFSKLDCSHRLASIILIGVQSGVDPQRTPTLYWGPVFLMGQDCKNQYLKFGTNYFHTAVIYLI